MLGLGEVAVHPGAAAAADPRRDRRAHHLGRGMGGIAPRAHGDAAAGAGRVGRGVARARSRARTGRNVGAIALFVAGGALLAAGVALGLRRRRSGWSSRSSAASCRSPDSRSAPRSSCRRCCGSSAACSAARRPRGWRPRTRCATRSAQSRMAIGVVMGVTLVTMFAVAIESVKAVMTAAGGGDAAARDRHGARLVRGDHDGPGRRLGGDRRRRAGEPADDRRRAAPPRARAAARARRVERPGAAHGAARGGARHDRGAGDRARARASSTAGRARSRCSARFR